MLNYYLKGPIKNIQKCIKSAVKVEHRGISIIMDKRSFRWHKNAGYERPYASRDMLSLRTKSANPPRADLSNGINEQDTHKLVCRNLK